MRKRMCRAFALALVAVLAFGQPAYAAGLSAANVEPAAKATAAAKTASFKSVKFTESGKYLNNPYRGWFGLTAYTLTESDSDNYVAKRLANDLEDSTYRHDLVLVEFNLKNYNGRNGNPTAIGEKGLKQAEKVLSAWEKKGKHVILRLVYDPRTTTAEDASLDGDKDYDGTPAAKLAEPASLGTLKGHITQLAPTINKHKKCVYMVQGTSMGAWGEMHTSNFTPDIDGSRTETYANIKKVLVHMGKTIDKSIFLAVRRPSYYRNTVSTSAPSSTKAFKGSLAARVSLFNDGMFGSSSDSGTYDSSRKTEIAFQQKLCQYVPNGGEVITLGAGGKVTDWNRFSTTATGARKAYGKSLIADMRAMHLSYLNPDYHDKVMANWKNSKFTGKGAFKNMNGKDYVERHLGYRYVLRGASAKANASAGTATIKISIENVGFSPAYRFMKSQITLVNTKGKVVGCYVIKSDNRFWAAGKKRTLSKAISLKGLAKGKYTAYYSLTDNASGKQIAFGNTATHTAKGYKLGVLTVK